MKPNPGDYVKLFLKKSVQIEGIVYSWDKKIVLSSMDGDSFMIINNSKKVEMYKLTPSSHLSKKNEPPHNKVEEIEEKTEWYDLLPQEDEAPKINHSNKTEYTDEEISKTVESDLKIKNLAELYQLKKEEDRKVIAEKLKQHLTNWYLN